MWGGSSTEEGMYRLTLRMIASQTRTFQPEGTTCTNATGHNRVWPVSFSAGITREESGMEEESRGRAPRAGSDRPKSCPQAVKSYQRCLHEQRFPMSRRLSLKHQRERWSLVARLTLSSLPLAVSMST